MVIFRYLGFGLCASSVLIMIYEILRYVETHTVNLLTLKQTLQNRAGSGRYFSGFLGDVSEGLLNMPLITVVIVMGVILIYLTRHIDG